MGDLTKARRMIAAIDKRIDAVSNELMRARGSFDKLSRNEWQRAWDSYPGLYGIHSALYARRGQWQLARDETLTKAAAAAARKERRRLAATVLKTCNQCGSLYREAA